ncbi:MAG: extracellular solute-binding protein [Lachnospiraceae bacterium]|nr:extracellular solute-binding protein [Lachnospiraceae bacterium]MBQ8634360.1 extracellular solute-binding protein [Lachnospiraceae bacterium]
MKHKLLKKILSSVLAATLVFSMAACGNDSENTVTSSSTKEETKAIESASTTESSTVQESTVAEVTYPIEGNVTLTIAMLDNATVNANAKHLFETPLGKAWQEATGVTIEVIQCANNDAMNLLIAGGELPDLIFFPPSKYSGGAEKAIKDGVIEPLNDYIDEFAPDLKEVLESNEIWYKTNVTSSGDIIGAPFIRGDAYLCSGAGLIIRQDWLDELNMEVPQTPDELYDVLVAFKEKKGATLPFTTTNSWMRNIVNYGMISSAYGQVKSDWYQIDGEIHYGRAEAEYKDTLAFLNKLYDEGLLDPNFASNDNNTVYSNMANGISGVTVGATGGYMGTILNAVEKDNPTYDLTGFGPLVAKEGDVAYSGYYSNALTGDTLFMTTQCKNKEAAVKFMNYGYTEEGYMLLNFGIEGESYTMVDGYPTYTELINNNPNGWSMQQALAQYTMSWNAGPFVQDKRYMEQYAARPQQKAAQALWAETDAAKYMVPTLSIAEEDQAEYSKLWADINTFVSEMMIQYITGTADLAKFETEYLDQLEAMGIDRVIELRQEALDAFNAR